LGEPFTVKQRFNDEDGHRSELLETARECAALTKPWLLPPQGQTDNDRLPEAYQSTGSRGLTNLEGRMLLALFPPGIPWFRHKLTGSIQYDPDVADEVKQQIASLLLLRDLTIAARLETTSLTGRYQRRSGFRSRKRMALSQILATGDTLEQLTDDYKLKIYGRQQYVTRRDSALDVIYHVIKETIDAQVLTDKQKTKADLPAEIYDDPNPAERMIDIYTLVEWQHNSNNWVIRQEINDNTVTETQEEITPFFSTPFELAPESNYGRGFIELNLPDLRSHNELRLKKLEFAGLAAKMLTVLDEGSNIRERDLEKPSGSIIRGRVRGGQVDDATFFKVDKLNDFSVVHQTDEAIRKDLGVAMLMESEVTPRGDRVTAFQVQRVAMELEGALGGVYSSIADEQQVPLLARLVHQMELDNQLQSIPPDMAKSIDLEATTGIAALSREMDSARIQRLIQGIATMGPEAFGKINVGVLVDSLARLAAFHEPGLIKTDEQIMEEKRQMVQQQLALTAGEKAIDTTGNIAENAAANTQQPQEQ
jgi:hypothetical protein